ncbi:hypothetical protein Tco_1382441 [Tanacetum coccineum]
MATPKPNKTLTTPCLSNSNPAKPKINDDAKIEISTGLIMMLRNNAFNEAKTNDVVDHFGRFLEIINFVKIPNVDPERLRVLNFWEKGYDNDTFIDEEESSDNESNESDQNPFSNPYQSDNEKGNKIHHTECNVNTNMIGKFKETHSDVKEQQDDRMCRVDKFEVIKYSIGDNEEFMGIRTLERHS